MKLGIIARCDNTGLGNQTRELVNMLSPNKILLVNSHKFNQNKQHPEWYSGYSVVETNGFPKTQEMKEFLNGLDVVLSCETFYGHAFIDFANRKNIKTVLQYNYEFLDHLTNHNISFPTIMLSPSLWKFDEAQKIFGHKTKLLHLPPPIDINNFNNAKQNNISKTHYKLLHIAGKKAAKDRNGTDTVVEMLNYSKQDYELVIKSQSDIDIKSKDSRLKVEISNVESNESLYSGFDAMVLPRRYAGLCLPMNEALLSGLPVFMTDISPNNYILPKDWLVRSEQIDKLKTRAMLDVYSADPKALAKIIDHYFHKDKKILEQKEYAFQIGYDNFSSEVLKNKYIDILK